MEGYAGLWALQTAPRPLSSWTPHAPTPPSGAPRRKLRLPRPGVHVTTAEGCATPATLNAPPALWPCQRRSNRQAHSPFSKQGPLPTDPVTGLRTAASDRQSSHETCCWLRGTRFTSCTSGGSRAGACGEGTRPGVPFPYLPAPPHSPSLNHGIYRPRPTGKHQKTNLIKGTSRIYFLPDLLR